MAAEAGGGGFTKTARLRKQYDFGDKKKPKRDDNPFSDDDGNEPQHRRSGPPPPLERSRTAPKQRSTWAAEMEKRAKERESRETSSSPLPSSSTASAGTVAAKGPTWARKWNEAAGGGGFTKDARKEKNFMAAGRQSGPDDDPFSKDEVDIGALQSGSRRLGAVPTFEPAAPKPSPSQPAPSHQPARQELRGEQQSRWNSSIAAANCSSSQPPLAHGGWDDPVDWVPPKPACKPSAAPQSPPASLVKQLNGPPPPRAANQPSAEGAARSALPQKSAAGRNEPAIWGPLQAAAKPGEVPPPQPAAPKPAAKVLDAEQRLPLQSEQVQLPQPQPQGWEAPQIPNNKPQASARRGFPPGASGQDQTATQPAAEDPATAHWSSAAMAADKGVRRPSSHFEGPRTPAPAAAPRAAANGRAESVNPAAQTVSRPMRQQPQSSTAMLAGQTHTNLQHTPQVQMAMPKPAEGLQQAAIQGEREGESITDINRGYLHCGPCGTSFLADKLQQHVTGEQHLRAKRVPEGLVVSEFQRAVQECIQQLEAQGKHVSDKSAAANQIQAGTVDQEVLGSAAERRVTQPPKPHPPSVDFLQELVARGGTKALPQQLPKASGDDEFMAALLGGLGI